MATTPDEVWGLLRELREAQQETERRFQETAQLFKDNEREREREHERERHERERERHERELERRETDRQIRNTDRQIKELGKQIGGLGEKFGSFTEGLALPSMERILRRRFQMEVVSPSVRVSKNGQHLELDVLSYANGPINAAYVVEVKSHLREEAITQLRDLLQRFRDFFPEHREKRLYGILAAVDLSAPLRERVLAAGFYAARIHDEVFTLDVPEGFEGRAF